MGISDICRALTLAPIWVFSEVKGLVRKGLEGFLVDLLESILEFCRSFDRMLEESSASCPNIILYICFSFKVSWLEIDGIT